MIPRRAERLGLTLVEAEPDSATTRLHVMVRQREALRASFQHDWRRIETLDSPAAVERWSAAALGLLQVHAGPGTLLALLSVSLEAGRPLGLGFMADVGVAAAAVCRQAGAGAAERVVRSVPILAAAGHDGPAIRAWIGVVERLAATRADAVPPLLATLPRLARATDAAGLGTWLATGLRVAPGRAQLAAFVSLATTLSRRVLAESAGRGGFAARERTLAATFRALWGIRPVIRPRDEDAATGAPPLRTTVAGGVILVPAGAPNLSAELDATFYDAALAHLGAHARFTGRMMHRRSLRPVQVAVVSAIEDARVEALAMRELPGLRRLWAPFHLAPPPPGLRSAAGLIARLSRLLFDPSLDDPEPWVAKGAAMFAQRGDRLADPSISREIGDLLGNDLGQMRLPFNAKTYVVEPAYRDDNFGLWDFDTPPEAPAEQHDLVLDSVRISQREDATDPDARPEQDNIAAETARARSHAAEAAGVAVARYPEWDHAVQLLRQDWATVVERPKTIGPAARLDERIAAEAGLSRRIERIVEAATLGRAVRQRRQVEGEQLDLDAAIVAATDQRLGRAPDARVFQRRGRQSRDLAAVVLIDTSESTRASAPGAGRSVLDLEVVAAAMLSDAMTALGDSHAIFGFCSNGRDAVHVTEVKPFGGLGRAARSALAGLVPGLSTRLGPALRHAASALSSRRALRKLLLVITDGRPSDIDVTDPAYLVEDARHAVAAARAAGIDVFAINLDASAAASARRIFGRGNALTLTRLGDLPARLAMLYFRLALR